MLLKLLFAFLVCCTSLSAKNIPLVTVEENNRLEDLADGTGVNEWRFMTNSGLAVALEAEKILASEKNRKVILLVGKGYKGGNALWGGYLLLQKGYAVEAYHLSPMEEAPEVCKKITAMFVEAGGVVQLFDSASKPEPDLIIDGLVGTGFTGSAKGRLAEAITWANRLGPPILAVDIPSGLNGNTGEVQTVAIRARHTIAISFPKIGFFLLSGGQHVGSLSVVNIGLEENVLVNAEAYICRKKEVSKYLKCPSIYKTTREVLAWCLKQKMQAEFTLQDYQQFAESIQTTVLFTDSPMMLITPSATPLIFEDVRQYAVDGGIVTE